MNLADSGLQAAWGSDVVRPCCSKQTHKEGSFVVFWVSCISTFGIFLHQKHQFRSFGSSIHWSWAPAAGPQCGGAQGRLFKLRPQSLTATEVKQGCSLQPFKVFLIPQFLTVRNSQHYRMRQREGMTGSLRGCRSCYQWWTLHLPSWKCSKGTEPRLSGKFLNFSSPKTGQERSQFFFCPSLHQTCCILSYLWISKLDKCWCVPSKDAPSQGSTLQATIPVYGLAQLNCAPS